MSPPNWITHEVIHAIQAALLARFGGASGVRDEGMLLSALERPRNLFAYEQAPLFKIAAANAYGIVKSRPFVDGNKRAGFMAAYTFLGANGQRFHATEEMVVLQTLALAAGDVDEAGYCRWLEDACAPAAQA